jgi:hypothetical protein
VLPSKVMLTDDQIQSLEHVFFSEPKALAEEVAAKREANEPFENTFYAQWYERLNDVKKHKIQHGTAVVSTALDEKLYHWNLRTRKRYHFTLFHKPHLKSSRSSRMDGEVDDAGWLLKMPNMAGSFVLSTASARAVSPSGVYPKKKYPTLLDENTDLDSETAFEIHHKHIQQVYFPEQPFHSSSLFWDECLEELRFFHGDNNHTIIPRSFPHNKHLSLWVEIQRAKLLLQLVGISSGILGSQMLVLDDELGLCDLRNSPLANTAKLPDAFANGIIREEANVLEDAEITPIKSNDGDDETKSQFNDGQAISVETIKSSKAIVLPSDITDDKSRIPLCKCPDCDKSFHALRKLYGHYGSSHAKTNGMKIDKKNIQYACPFCTSDTPVEVSEYHQFKQLSRVTAHVKASHPDCCLVTAEYRLPANIKTNKSTTPKRKAKSQPDGKATMWKQHLDSFTSWLRNSSSSNQPMPKDLYNWCWRQCNGASALLCGTPLSVGVKMNKKKLQIVRSHCIIANTLLLATSLSLPMVFLSRSCRRAISLEHFLTTA